MRLKDLLVQHYFLPLLDSKCTINVKISAFPSDKCLNFLPVHLYFYLSRTGGQSIISIPVMNNYFYIQIKCFFHACSGFRSVFEKTSFEKDVFGYKSGELFNGKVFRLIITALKSRFL